MDNYEVSDQDHLLGVQIFGIYMLKEGSQGQLEDVLQPGTQMVAAGYCMYGSSCTVCGLPHQQVAHSYVRPSRTETSVTPDLSQAYTPGSPLSDLFGEEGARLLPTSM